MTRRGGGQERDKVYSRKRPRPTMSERERRRPQAEPQPEVEPQGEPQPQVEPQAEPQSQTQPEPQPLALPPPNLEADLDAEADAEPDAEPVEDAPQEMDDEETYPYPGGPENNTVLISYKKHVARALWKGIERPILRMVYHTNKLMEWSIEAESSSAYFKQIYSKTGLSMVPPMSYSGCDKNVITAFVERWHPETNTFHLPFGEMTITLDDVLCLTGLRVEGSCLKTSISGRRYVVAQLCELFGVSPEMARAEARGGIRGSSCKLEWLHKNFSDHLVDKSREKVKQGCRAYLLYMLGCALFSDKSGTKVGTQWLEYVSDIDKVNKYAWGAATLAYLYRQLGHASQFGCRQLSGYLTLLQAWIYERFPCFRAAINVNYVVGQPLAYRWTTSRHAGPSASHVQAHRETLDFMTADQVIWCPYGQDVRAHYPLSSVAYYDGCLCAHDVVEPYHPGRVLRQFGFVQTIPNDPVDIRRHDFRAKAFLASLAAYYDRWRDHVLRPETFKGRAVPQWECADDYMDWYRKCSHPIIQNPANRSSAAWGDMTTPTDPWGLITKACNVLEQHVDRWVAGEHELDWPEVMTHVVEAYRTLKSTREDDTAAPGPSRRGRGGGGRRTCG